MENLRQLLQDKLDWVMETRGATHVNVKLTGEQLATLMDLLALVEMVESNLPKIEPRMLVQQEPRGTMRSQEEIRAILQAAYGGGNPYNSGGFKVLA